jgi:N-acetyl-gamma-glutamyl-phosphate reductase
MKSILNKNALEKPLTLGIVGVRGYVGLELIRLLAVQKNLKIAWVSSRQLAGKKLSELLNKDDKFQTVSLDSEHYFHQLQVDNMNANQVARKHTDIVVLALPNGLAKDFVSELEQTNNCRVIIDLSADYRFDDSWIYSIPEINCKKLKGISTHRDSSGVLKNSHSMVKISNPGCYATAMQVAIAPLVGMIQGRINCFGISGYSGAGTNPSPSNDTDNLRDNILPYGLVEHIHEKEVSYQLNQPVSFSPHVASFFRGINMTSQIELKRKSSKKEIMSIFQNYYKDAQCVQVAEAIPNIQQVNHTANVLVGGFKLSADGKRLTIASCLDNLLKGAASQALQNIATACQLEIDLLGDKQ